MKSVFIEMLFHLVIIMFSSKSLVTDTEAFECRENDTSINNDIDFKSIAELKWKILAYSLPKGSFSSTFAIPRTSIQVFVKTSQHKGKNLRTERLSFVLFCPGMAWYTFFEIVKTIPNDNLKTKMTTVSRSCKDNFLVEGLFIAIYFDLIENLLMFYTCSVTENNEAFIVLTAKDKTHSDEINYQGNARIFLRNFNSNIMNQNLTEIKKYSKNSCMYENSGCIRIADLIEIGFTGELESDPNKHFPDAPRNISVILFGIFLALLIMSCLWKTLVFFNVKMFQICSSRIENRTYPTPHVRNSDNTLRIENLGI